MTPHKVAFDMYEVIPTRNVHMGDDSIVEANCNGIHPCGNDGERANKEDQN